MLLGYTFQDFPTLGGIAELARATFAKDGSGPSTASDPASGPWDKKE